MLNRSSVVEDYVIVHLVDTLDVINIVVVPRPEVAEQVLYLVSVPPRTYSVKDLGIAAGILA